MHQAIRVLVVDDDTDSAEVLALLLHEIGCDARAATSAEQAIRIAPMLSPDLVILDLMMPRMTGFETLAALKLQPWSAQAVFVAHSGVTTTAVLAEARAAGFQDVLIKPAPFEQIERIVASVKTSRSADVELLLQTETPLQMARRHMRIGETAVDRQRSILERLKKDGFRRNDAERLLRTLDETLDLMREHLKYEVDKAARSDPAKGQDKTVPGSSLASPASTPRPSGGDAA